MSHPKRMPAAPRITTLRPSTMFQESIPFRSDRKMAIKSVPPVVAFIRRHRLMTTPLMRPPKILISRVS